MKTPMAPRDANRDVIITAPTQKLTTTNLSFENRTGAIVNRLVVVFGTNVTDVLWAPYPHTLNASTLELSGLALPSSKHVQLKVSVSGNNARIASWYWALADGTPVDLPSKGCSGKSGCSEIAAIEALDLVTPAITIGPQAGMAYCFYFKTPNETSVVLRSLQSHQEAAILRMNLVLTASETHPAGTMTTANCGPIYPPFVSSTYSWIYTAYAADNVFNLPADDGSGKPLGFILPPHATGYVYLLFKNPIDSPITPYAELRATELPAGSSFTPAAPLTAYDNSISIPAENTAYSQQDCAVPPGVKFFWMSTYAHPQMVHGTIWDVDVVFESFNPLNPGVKTWGPPFLSFASGRITYRFDYANFTNRTITTGPSYFTDEQGIVLSWIFPATGSKYCFDGLGAF
jgi:hypothetical protein